MRGGEQPRGIVDPPRRLFRQWVINAYCNQITLRRLRITGAKAGAAKPKSSQGPKQGADSGNGLENVGNSRIKKVVM
jgi:hypothetical protein